MLKQAEDGTPVGEVCRKAGISDATFYNWRKKYAGLMPSEMKRLRQLEEENAKLKRIVADLSLDKAMLQDVRPRAQVCRRMPASFAAASNADRASASGTTPLAASRHTFQLGIDPSVRSKSLQALVTSSMHNKPLFKQAANLAPRVSAPLQCVR
ncbi:AcrR family transcriptional regulator [Rhizobium lentis]|uniref:AcrR family transcriptional regulator n=1 Tax=Rhizobium lentis TaxID=1138194 RepID=A0A7W8UNT1_9HYPH|nr:AcrR family transcriptional regulator [Rhizobium lentis]MBB5550462.1 AcrR family transcriptional regulator [Rhizobium lentis]MBB5561416.1 AcrR family transcriptional regulator [Rhizobium lentis]MBB5567581.1 AcrR family transcriptional regulator [Rhizobium lentis]